MDVIIDGKTCIAEPGQYILEIARQNDIDIPSLCHHEALPGQACCRLCLVEIEDAAGCRLIVASCVYPVEESIVVYTKSERIIRLRRTVLVLLKERAPGAEGALPLYCHEYGVAGQTRFNEAADEKCILCGLCVKACGELGNSAIQTAMRGVDKAVMPPFNEPPLTCTGCASCARVCPTNAIDWTNNYDQRVIWGKTFPLVKCAACGKPYATAEELAWLHERLLETELNQAYCPECRGRVSVNPW